MGVGRSREAVTASNVKAAAQSFAVEKKHSNCRTTDSPVTVVTQGLVYAVPSHEILPGCTNGHLFRKKNALLEKSKILLDNVSIFARPGELLAIVGASGSGKTTLLNVLALRSPPHRIPSGCATFNGRKETKETVKSSVNYVMAHDKQLPYLTVYETLKNAAALKLPHLSAAMRRERVEQVINDMSLQRCRNTYIGGEWRKGISTGELKRVAIGIELLDEPSVLILDEPTSGLDSSLSIKVMEILLTEARKGRTVICSLHQPSSQVFQLFDRLLLLSLGRVVYHGPADSALAYFGKLGYSAHKDWNPCDFLLDLISDNQTSSYLKTSEPRDANLADLWNASSENAIVLDECNESVAKLSQMPRKTIPNRRGASWAHEVGTLWKRTTMNSIRNPLTATILVLIQAMQGLVLGGIFFNQSTAWSGPQPPALLEPSFWNNQYVKTYMYGAYGKGIRPFLEIFEKGFDGNGSYILTGPTQPERAWEKPIIKILGNMSPCLYAKFKMSQRGYLEMKTLRSISEWEELTPEMIYSSVMGLYQVFDLKYMTGPRKLPMDLSFVLLKEFALFTYGAKREIAAFTDCLDWNILQSESLDLEKDLIRNYSTPDLKQKDYSLRTGSKTVDNMIRRLVSSNIMQLLDAASEWVIRSTSCKDEICQKLKDFGSVVSDFFHGTFQTVTTILNLSGCLFFVSTILGFASYDALLTFPQERALFNRESANGLYRSSSYYVAKNLADLPFQLIPSLLMASIYYSLVGFDRTLPQFLIYFLTCILTSFCAYGFGYMVSAASPRMEIAILVAPLTLVIWLVLAGFFLRDPDIPSWISWFKYLSFYRWSFFTLVTNQFPPGGYFGTLPNKIVLSIVGVTQANIATSLAFLCCLGLGYRILGYLFLSWTNRSVGLEA